MSAAGGWLAGSRCSSRVAATAGAQTPAGDPLAEARALVRAGKLEEAVAAYTRVLEANPGGARGPDRARPGPRVAPALPGGAGGLRRRPRRHAPRRGHPDRPEPRPGLREAVRRGRGRGPPRAGRRSRGRRGAPRPRRLLRLAAEVRGGDRRVRAGPGARAAGARALARPRQGASLAGGPEGRDGSLRGGPPARPGQRRRERGAGPDRRDPPVRAASGWTSATCTRRSARA